MERLVISSEEPLMQALRMTPPFHWARPRWMEEVERLLKK